MVDIHTGEEVKLLAIKYAEILRQKYDLHSLYLYGSYVNGNYTSDSDIDIAVIAANFSGDIFEDTLSLMRYRRLVDNRIEPHPFIPSDFNPSNPNVREIMAKGIRII
jgi:predicted nucleotidyltransferase